MSNKELRLDFEATFVQAVSGHGHAHYGYWSDDLPVVPTFQALCTAQQAYFELLADHIPHETKTILDVGSGTGANAVGLTEKGYALECLSPSKHLNNLARGKLPETVLVHDTTFENFQSDRRFDLCLFAESFHYTVLQKALAQLDRYAEKNALIFDYFRRDPDAFEDGTRGTHGEFRQAVDDQGVFTVVSDVDLTEAILPTFEVLDHLRTELFGPFVERARKRLSKQYPKRARLAEWFFGRKFDKIMRPGGRAEQFGANYEYRLIVTSRS